MRHRLDSSLTRGDLFPPQARLKGTSTISVAGWLVGLPSMRATIRTRVAVLTKDANTTYHAKYPPITPIRQFRNRDFNPIFKIGILKMGLLHRLVHFVDEVWFA